VGQFGPPAGGFGWQSVVTRSWPNRHGGDSSLVHHITTDVAGSKIATQATFSFDAETIVPPSIARRFADWLHELAPTEFGERQHCRTIWISEVHLGTPDCAAEILVDFLRSTDCETHYLVGDIINGWQLRKGRHRPARHNDVVRCILKQAKRGTRVVYVPGNHDEAMRDHIGLNFGGVEVTAEAIHLTANGPPPAGPSWRRVRWGHARRAMARGDRRPGLRAIWYCSSLVGCGP